MSINWNWKDKIGELVIDNYGKEYTINVYECNGLAVFIHEWEENEIEKYELYGFFADENHMKNCLGLTKGYENMYANTFKKITLKQCKTTIKLLQAFVKAKWENDIEIILQTELPF